VHPSAQSSADLHCAFAVALFDPLQALARVRRITAVNIVTRFIALSLRKSEKKSLYRENPSYQATRLDKKVLAEGSIRDDPVQIFR
jgi:hypothetical protein